MATSSSYQRITETYQLLTEWAFQERLCCPFFDIDLRFDRENGPLWLRLTGRPGTKEFIKERDLTSPRFSLEVTP